MPNDSSSKFKHAFDAPRPFALTILGKSIRVAVRKKKNISYTLKIAIGLLCISCTSGQLVRSTSATDARQLALEDASKQALGVSNPDLPADIGRALLPSLRFHTAIDETPQIPRFDLNATNMPARELYLNLMSSSPYNIVVHPSVTGKISIHLKNVTLEEALQAVRDVYGYEYQRNGNQYLILGNTPISRIYPVNYLDFKRRGGSTVNIAASGFRSSGSGSSGSSNSTSGGTGSEGSSGGNTAAISLDTTSETHFWKDLENALKAILGEDKSGERRAVANPAAGLVVVRATPRELRLVEEFLGLTQTNLHRQVIIEAKIIEVELDEGLQSGINWTAMAGGIRAAQNGGGTAISSGVSENYGSNVDLANSSLPNANVSSFGGVFSLAFSTGHLGSFIELLQTQGKIRVLSSPRVATLNNQKAVIKVGDDNFYITRVTNSTTTSTAGTTASPTVELSPFFSGVALDVTPQIDNATNILLHIHPAISDVSQLSKVFTIGGQSYELPVASSNIQESDNVVRARSGQMVVIGGLMKDTEINREASIPLLGGIPVLGELFKQHKRVKIKKELVILLKPTIIDYDGEQWRKEIDKSVDHTKQINALTE